MVNTSCQPTFLSKYIFCPFRQAENYFSLCTCCVDDFHFITWALWWAPVWSETTWASSRLILFCVGLKHILTSLCYSWRRQAAITHKAPRQDSCLVNGGYDYARHSLRRWKQFLSWFTGLIGPDPWVCWPLTNQGKLQRWNSLFCEPSPNSLTPTQSLRDYVQSKAWRSRGFVSAQQCQSWTRVFWKHLGSKISLKLTQELKIIFNPIRDRSKFVFFILLWAARN